MEPRPDHGESSYRGARRLVGRKALITGGDSGMGRAAAIAYAREGADVAINYFPTEEPDAKEVIELIKGEAEPDLPFREMALSAKHCCRSESRAGRPQLEPQGLTRFFAIEVKLAANRKSPVSRCSAPSLRRRQGRS